MRNLSRDANLVMELGEPRRIALQIDWKELQRDGLPETQVVSAVDLAHAAAPEETNNSVSFAENGTRRKAPMVDGV
jgi:hypothetical protein